LPNALGTAAATAPGLSRRRLTRRRLGNAVVPYLLLAPVVLVIGATLGYPIYNLIRLSGQKYDLFALIQHHGTSVGLKNYSSVLHDSIFWHTLLRTVVFTVVNVGLTLTLGMLTALLFLRVSTWVRVMLSAGLVLVWATPPVVAVQVWLWMTNSQNGILNSFLTDVLHVGNYFQHDWYVTPFSQLAMVTTLVVWGAVPFVTITLYAALTQVPRDLVEAAEIDGATAWRVFRDITVPVIMPALLILTSLSILWDFGVFTQAYLLIGAGHIIPQNYLMGIYLFQEGYVRTDFGRGAAISILMLLIVGAMSVVYVRRMIRIGNEA
jgi:N,N'-diacetylchitobiose transport system permease protein